jgi:lactate dehydrogenase-like 2-hydroxyacid dehydrogenase
MVTHTPNVLNDDVADLAIGLMLCAARQLPAADRFVRAGHWLSGAMPLARKMSGARLGLVGMGRIGQAIATRAAAFGMEIHYHNRRPLPAAEEGGATYHARLDTLLPLSQFLMLACPLTPETHHLLDDERIARLPEGAIVVNIARGNVVKDDALIAALRSGKVRAAGLDVFTNEPNLDARYYDLPNAFILPHIGSSTIEAREGMARILLDAFDAVERGQAVSNRLA